MTISRFEGRCHHCGHDHDADNEAFQEALKSPPSESSATNFNAAQPGASMENQHKHIKGYRDLSQSEIDAMNAIKAKAEEVGALVSQLRAQGSLDQRWVSIGATDLQTGFMALTRSIAQPTTF